MSKPKRHHFIPKSYLKNFAQKHGEKYFVEAKRNDESEVKDELISTVDICVEKNLYTIPNVEGDDKYAIERYYASEIDAIYPDIYTLLVDEGISALNEQQHRQVILTTMSLYFRTPKFLNMNIQYLEEVLEYAVMEHIDETGRVKVDIDGYQLDFHIEEFDEVKAKLKIENKLDFLDSHMKNLHEFVEYKMKAGMMMVKITSEAELITCDNPVIMKNRSGRPFNVFDPDNMINVPIDNKHYLMIAPNSEGAMQEQVFRCEHNDVMFALTTNLEIERNAETWIFGKPGTVCGHFADQAKYNEMTSENLEHVVRIEARSKNYVRLSEMIDRYGITHSKTLAYIEHLTFDPLHEGDTNIRKDYDELKKLGWIK